MINLVTTINTPITLAFTATTGLTTFSDFAIVLNGALVVSPVYTLVEIPTTGIYIVTYTPLATGSYIFRASGAIYAAVQVQTRSLVSYLQNIEDEALGSWTWNKQSGTLNLLRQDGTSLANYTVVETLTAASRERI